MMYPTKGLMKLVHASYYRGRTGYSPYIEWAETLVEASGSLQVSSFETTYLGSKRVTVQVWPTEDTGSQNYGNLYKSKAALNSPHTKQIAAR